MSEKTAQNLDKLDALIKKNATTSEPMTTKSKSNDKRNHRMSLASLEQRSNDLQQRTELLESELTDKERVIEMLLKRCQKNNIATKDIEEVLIANAKKRQLLVVSHSASQATTKSQLMQEKMQQILELQEQTAKEMSKRNLTPRTPKATQLNLTPRDERDATKPLTVEEDGYTLSPRALPLVNPASIKKKRIKSRRDEKVKAKRDQPETEQSPTKSPTFRIVRFDHTADESDELTIKKGDRIGVVQAGEPDGWWRGKLYGKEGLFPVAFTRAEDEASDSEENEEKTEKNDDKDQEKNEEHLKTKKHHHRKKKDEKGESKKTEKIEKTEKAEKSEKTAEKLEKTEKTEKKSEKIEKTAEKLEKTEKIAEKSEKSEKTEKSPEKSEKSVESKKSEKSEKSESKKSENSPKESTKSDSENSPKDNNSSPKKSEHLTEKTDEKKPKKKGAKKLDDSPKRTKEPTTKKTKIVKVKVPKTPRKTTESYVTNLMTLEEFYAVKAQPQQQQQQQQVADSSSYVDALNALESFYQ